MTNSADPDQLASSDCLQGVYPGSAGLRLKIEYLLHRYLAYSDVLFNKTSQ